MTTTPARQHLIDKIRKLLALSSSPNEHEAMSALSMANELMQRHQIAMTDVDVAEVKKSGIARELYVVPGLRMKYIWIETLASACAKLYDGSILVHSRLHGTKFTFIGTPDDIRLMKATFEYLWGSWQSIVLHDLDDAKSNSGHSFQPRDTMKFKHGHGQGFSFRVYQRAVELASARKVAVRSTGNALVVLKENMLREWMTENNIVSVKQKQTLGSSIGQGYGARAGNSIPLGGAISGGK